MRSITRLYLISTLGLLAVGIAVIFLLRPGPKPKVTLNDGSILSLERIEYQSHSQRPRPRGIEVLRAVITQWTGQPTFRRHAEPGSMVMWFSLREKDSGNYVKPNFVRVVAVDEHGCEFFGSDFILHGHNWSSGGFPWAQPPAGVASKYIMVSGLLRSFPTRQTEFPIRLYDSKGGLVAEFRVPNLARAKHAVWNPAPLPATNTSGDVTVILESITNRLTVSDRYGDMWERLQVVPSAKLLHNGQGTTNWRLQAFYLSDATGQRVNADAASLCTNESAWKAELEYERKPTAEFATNESWTMTSLPIPSAGKVVQLGKSNLVQGVTLELLAVAGAAVVTYSNGVPISTAVSGRTGGSSVSTSSGMIGGARTVQVTVDSGKPNVILLVKNRKDSMRLALRAKDDTGRETLAMWPNMTAGGPGVDFRMFELDTGTNAKTIDISFFVHQSRKFEFFVQPPPPLPTQPDEWTEAQRVRSVAEIPARAAELKAGLIDLTPFYTRGLGPRYIMANGSVKNGSWSRSYNFLSLPSGVAQFGGIHFDVRGTVQLSGLALLKAEERFPKKVTGIPIGRSCKRIHFLHGAIWRVEDESEIGQFVIHFENGETLVRPIRYGIDVRDWDLFNDEPPQAREAELILISRSDASPSDSGHLYKTTFENPQPGRMVKSIDFISRNTAAGPFLIAISVE